MSGRGRAAAGRPELLQKALALQARYAPDGVTISNSLQTNGTLINDAWCRLFREHGFIIGLSLEGNEALQDYHRPDKRGRSTWSAALRGIDLLHQHQVDFNLLVVVHNEMAAHAAAIYDRLVSLGARYLQFQPLMSEGAALREGYQLSADNWGRFMVGIWRQWRKRCDRGGCSLSISNRRGRSISLIPAAAACTAPAAAATW